MTGRSSRQARLLLDDRRERHHVVARQVDRVEPRGPLRLPYLLEPLHHRIDRGARASCRPGRRTCRGRDTPRASASGRRASGAAPCRAPAASTESAGCASFDASDRGDLRERESFGDRDDVDDRPCRCAARRARSPSRRPCAARTCRRECRGRRRAAMRKLETAAGTMITPALATANRAATRIVAPRRNRHAHGRAGAGSARDERARPATRKRERGDASHAPTAFAVTARPSVLRRKPKRMLEKTRSPRARRRRLCDRVSIRPSREWRAAPRRWCSARRRARPAVPCASSSSAAIARASVERGVSSPLPSSGNPITKPRASSASARRMISATGGRFPARRTIDAGRRRDRSGRIADREPDAAFTVVDRQQPPAVSRHGRHVRFRRLTQPCTICWKNSLLFFERDIA